MDINIDPAMYEWVVERLRADQSKPKPSPHSTQLIYCLTRSYHDLVDPLPLSDKELLLFAVGFGMERLLLGKHDDQPVQVDGIWASPDFVMANGESRYGELKTTRVKPPAQGTVMSIPDGWHKQIMAYCHCLKVTEYRLAVVHIIQPVLTTWCLRFTREELDGNWAWLQDRLTIFNGFLGKVEVPTPFRYNMDWECSYCRYRPECDMARIRGTL